MVVGLYLFIWKQRIGDLIVWILETVFDTKHEAAFYYYSDHFRGNKEIFFAVAVLLIFTVLMVRIFRWVTGYFREVNQGIESLLADDEKQIQLSPEMLPFERKLNSVKQTLAERKMETALAEQRKDELVMYLAHDIRTPLTSVIGYLNLLEEDPNMPPEQRAARVHIALEKAYRLETMVNEFFEITKYKSQKITLSKETIDLYYMLVQLSDELSPVLAPRGNTVTLHLDENLTIEADPEKLARVFNNILKNAASYSFPHTKSARASRRPARKPLIRTIGTPTRSFTFWNGGNTRAAPSISRPTPIPSGTRSSLFSGMVYCADCRAKMRYCTTTTLKSGRIILCAPTIAAIREAVRHTSSVRSFWRNWSGCT